MYYNKYLYKNEVNILYIDNPGKHFSIHNTSIMMFFQNNTSKIKRTHVFNHIQISTRIASNPESKIVGKKMMLKT